MYHEGESIGGHTSAIEILAKIAQTFWWPSMASEVRRWVGSCSVCRLSKPQPEFTVAQRMELHYRPFRILFVDTIGPISPSSEGNFYILHAEEPFTRFCWLKAAVEDSADVWAKFLWRTSFPTFAVSEGSTQ